MTASQASAAEKEVRAWGFNRVFTWTDPPYAYYQPHSHKGLTTHLILSGSLAISYPGDDSGKEIHGVGVRLDVPAHKVHEVWIGSEGCTMVIGE